MAWAKKIVHGTIKGQKFTIQARREIKTLDIIKPGYFATVPLSVGNVK